MIATSISPFEPPKARLAGDVADRWRSPQPHAKAARFFRAVSVVPGLLAAASLLIAGADVVFGHALDLQRVFMITTIFLFGPAGALYAIALGLVSKAPSARVTAAILCGGLALLVPIGTVIALYVGMQLWKWELPKPDALENDHG